MFGDRVEKLGFGERIEEFWFCSVTGEVVGEPKGTKVHHLTHSTGTSGAALVSGKSKTCKRKGPSNVIRVT